jgi:uncharacterized membrane protein
MSGKTIYSPYSILVLAILLAILLPVVALVFVGVLGAAFAKVGLSPIAIALILIATFVGSYINIPVGKLKSSVPVAKEEYVNFFGVRYRTRQIEYGQSETVVAVNVGGALMPTGVCIYLLSRSASSTIFYSIIGVAIVALITHLVARPVKGEGIVTPTFVPPIAAAVVAIILQPSHAEIIAYVAGVLGALIGADLTNLRAIPKLGAPMASIGGAGTFDGVFLTGIIAVLLAGL